MINIFFFTKKITNFVLAINTIELKKFILFVKIYFYLEYINFKIGLMKTKLFVIILVFICGNNFLQAQCTGACTQTVTGSGNFLNATGGADVFCITSGTVGIDGINNFGPGDQICVSGGATLNLGSNFGMGVNGASPTAFAMINVAAGSTVNYAGSGGNGGMQINNAGTFNFTSTSNVTLISNGGAKQEFNNLEGGVLNALTMPIITWQASSNGEGARFVNAGTINANNIELAEAANPQNLQTGVINVKRAFYIHSLGFTDCKY